MKAKLTNASVQALSCDTARPLVVHDEECRGFCVAVGRSGKKLFQFYGRVGGKPRRIKIGEFPSLSVSDARRRAREIIGDIARGKDPTPWKVKGITLADAYDSYMRLHSRERKRTAGRDETTWKKWLATWGPRVITTITRSDCGLLVEEIQREHSKSTAHKVRALLSSIFSFSIRQGWLDRNPVHLTHRPTYDKRERYLRPDEVKAFFIALAKVRRETTRDYIAMLIWTGQRRSNVGAMRWDEIDMTAAVWSIPSAKFKGKRTHVVPLAGPAMEILKRRKERATSVYVFPGGGCTGHLVEPKAAWAKLLDAAGIDDLRVHDLRRTMGAWQNADGTSLRTIQQGLGHSDIRTTASVYTPVEVEAVREAMQAYADAITRGSRPD